jgi:hypothetical protein
MEICSICELDHPTKLCPSFPILNNYLRDQMKRQDNNISSPINNGKLIYQVFLKIHPHPSIIGIICIILIFQNKSNIPQTHVHIPTPPQMQYPMPWVPYPNQTVPGS